METDYIEVIPDRASPPAAETLSTLAAGTLHDVSHLLVQVLGCAELVLDDPHLSPRSRRLVEDAIQAGERAGVLARQMLAFARGQADAPAGMVDVVTALRAAEPVVRRIGGRGVAVAVTAGGPPLWVRAAAVDLDRLVVGLVSHGREAMPHGGRLSLRAVQAPAAHGKWPAGPVARITAAATAHGNELARTARPGDALATARAGDRDAAPGLDVVRAAVARLGGTLRITSTPAGTTVVVDLPIVQVPG